MPITGEALKKLEEGSSLVLESPKATPVAEGGMPTSGESFGSAMAQGGKEVANEFGKGFWNMLGTMVEAGAAGGATGEMPFATVARMVLPREMMNMDPRAKQAAQVVSEMGVGPEGLSDKFTDPTMKPTSAPAKILGAAARAAGGSVLMPGGSIISGAGRLGTALNPIDALKNFMIASGAGAGGEAGGDILEGLTKWGARLFTNDPEKLKTAGKVGEGVGNVAGSVLGGYAGGAVKSNAIGAVLKAPITAAGQAKEAFQAARAAQRAGDERSMFAIFTDNFGTLRKESSGMIDRWVMEQFIDTARKSPVARPLYEAAKQDAAKIGKDLENFTPAQVTADPVIVEQTRALTARTPEQGEQMVRRMEGSKATLKEAFEKVMGYSVKGNPKTIMDSIEGVRKETVSKIAFIDAAADDVVAKLPKPSTVGATEAGSSIRSIVDDPKTGLRQKYLDKSTENYAKAIETDKGFNTAYDLDQPLTTTKQLLAETTAKLNPASVDESIRKLQGLMEESKAGTRSVNLGDINDTLKVLNKDITAASNPLGDQTKRRNLLKVKDELLGVIEKQAPQEVKDLYKEATRFHGEEYGKRFKEGFGGQLRKDNRAIPGRDAVPNDAVMDKIVPKGGKGSEDVLKETDRLFAGDEKMGIPRNREFYDRMGDKVLERFNEEVVAKAMKLEPQKRIDALEQGIDDFERAYGMQLERVPEAFNKAHRVVLDLSRHARDKIRQLDDFKSLVKSPMTQTFGVDGADKLLSHAMSDKAYMARLVDKIGPEAVLKEVLTRANPMKGLDFDAGKLRATLNAGKRGQEGPTALQYVLEKQLGAEKGKAHFDQLQAIANLSERIALGDPRYVNPRTPFGEGYMQEKLGQSMASILTSGKATMEGRVSPLYSGVWMGGRFLNGKVQKAISDAQFDVLFNPEKAKAFYKALETPPGTPIEAEVMAKLFGKSQGEMKDFAAKLLEKGRVPAIMARSAVIGQQPREERE